MLQISAVKTPVFRAGDRLLPFLVAALRGKVQARDVVAITSKIFSVAEGRIVPKNPTLTPEAEKKEKRH